MKNYQQEKTFSGAAQLIEALAVEIQERLQAAIAKDGKALIAVSGGRSPIPLFQKLTEADLPWEKVTITLVDERWVDPGDDDSNEKLVRQNLLKGKAAKARFVPLKNNATTPEEGVDECHSALSTLPMPFDVVVLGMGDDGHTASFFPHAPGLAEAIATDSKLLCAAVRPSTAPHPRMTLTLNALQDSHWVVLPLQGDSKLKTYRTACEDGPVEGMPVRSVLRQSKAPVEVWLAL